MKKLIIISHPKIELSNVNRRWMDELAKYPDEFTIHHLEAEYPDGKIDVASEQQLVEAHSTLIFQFPFYWFSSPPMVKQWLDEVLLYGWAYGAKGDRLNGKTITLATSAGITEEGYQTTGEYKVTIDQLILPFITSVNYVGANFEKQFVLYDSHKVAELGDLDQSALDYLDFLRKL